MKKIFLLFLILLSGIANASADQYSDNPSRYVQTIRSDRYVAYIDKDALRVLRYDPPYYVLEADTVYVLYELNQMMRTKERFFYNMDAGTMKSIPMHFTMYDENGKILSDEDSNQVQATVWKPREQGWYIADHVFMLEYNLPFTVWRRQSTGR